MNTSSNSIYTFLAAITICGAIAMIAVMTGVFSNKGASASEKMQTSKYQVERGMSLKDWNLLAK